MDEGWAPDLLVVRNAGFPDRSRTLCPYPLEAHYAGGDPNDAGSFSCAEPTP